MNHGLLRACPVDRVASIDQQIIRRNRKLLHGDAHRQQRSLANVDAIDRLHINRRDGKCQSLGANHHVELVAFVFAELFRIVQSRQPATQRQNHGGGNDRPEHRPAPHLVASGDPQKAAFAAAFSSFQPHARHVPSIRTNSPPTGEPLRKTRSVFNGQSVGTLTERIQPSRRSNDRKAEAHAHSARWIEEKNPPVDDGMVNDSFGTVDIADSTGLDETKETGDAKRLNKETHED